MDWDRISTNWSHWRDRVRERWSRLTELELTAVAGRREVLAARIQEVYGLSPEETERQLLNNEPVPLSRLNPNVRRMTYNRTLSSAPERSGNCSSKSSSGTGV